VTVHSSEPVGHAYAGKGRTTPERLLALAHAFPDVRLVLAHWGGGLLFYCLMPEVAGATSQVYYDTAASPLLYDARVFDAVATLAGAGKVLVWSDYPLVRHRRLRRQVEESGLSAFDRQAVLGGNAQALLGGRL
jgi:predicted TIM-barrel fold metal-dependent hydrolase